MIHVSVISWFLEFIESHGNVTRCNAVHQNVLFVGPLIFLFWTFGFLGQAGSFPRGRVEMLDSVSVNHSLT